MAGHFGTIRWSPQSSPVFNPAFDTTPHELVTAWIFEAAVLTESDIQKGALAALKRA